MAPSVHQAVLQNDLNLVRHLLHRKGSLLNLQDAYGATPLMLAAMIRSAKLVTFLLQKGALWDIKDYHGHTAVKYADGRRSLRIFKLIKKVKLVGKITRQTTSACIAPGITTRPQMSAVVRDIAKLLGFNLPKHCYDSPRHDPAPGPHNEGRYHASHCEKLLAGYWVTEQLQYAFGSSDLSRMQQRKNAALFLDHRPCIPCLLFLGEIQRATGIKVCAIPQASVREVSRNEKRGVCENCTRPKCASAGTKPVKKRQPAGTTIATTMPDHLSDDTTFADSERIPPANFAQLLQRATNRPGTPAPLRRQTKPETWLEYPNNVWKPPRDPILEENFRSDYLPSSYCR
ncbi:hypothetical protein CONLIGDRAFT_649997 [Coniochaeta ligniaria NRRL 30616]|uniref:Single-strand DNA deaminase toxin A-like C-terminal domain-containing protein n=1 Tax=Coniochaeta ligniaria NRRL 30616 TaxID=1408157 RepID=A0A1J7J009_9PEZI|nr:hypothetical protein CONLIGDRAFT_649997 [Coniochaeta ligniaria NRRL 30616]